MKPIELLVSGLIFSVYIAQRACATERAVAMWLLQGTWDYYYRGLLAPKMLTLPCMYQQHIAPPLIELVNGVD